MVLAIDVGNSNIVVGGYGEGGALCFLERFATIPGLPGEEYAGTSLGNSAR